MNTDRAAESTDIPPEIDDLYEGVRRCHHSSQELLHDQWGHVDQ